MPHDPQAILPKTWQSPGILKDRNGRLLSVRDQTAVIYCEGNFGGIDGKTANGLVRHSEKYRVLSVIDSNSAGGMPARSWMGFLTAFQSCAVSRRP